MNHHLAMAATHGEADLLQQAKNRETSMITTEEIEAIAHKYCDLALADLHGNVGAMADLIRHLDRADQDAIGERGAAIAFERGLAARASLNCAETAQF